MRSAKEENMETKGKGEKGKRRPKRLPAEVQAMVDGGRMLYSIMAAIVSAVVEVGGSGEHIRRLDQPEGKRLIRQLAELIMGKVAIPVIWDVVLKWIIAACRFVSDVNKNITGENFPFTPGDLDFKEITIVSIKEEMDTEHVLEFLDKMGLQPARLVSLLWWWLAHHPAERSHHVVFALGSVWQDTVPFINGIDRALCLCPVKHRYWQPYQDFAAVPKAKAA